MTQGLNEIISVKGVCKTALAPPGLLNTETGWYVQYETISAAVRGSVHRPAAAAAAGGNVRQMAHCTSNEKLGADFLS